MQDCQWFIIKSVLDEKFVDKMPTGEICFCCNLSLSSFIDLASDYFGQGFEH
jgi:hypothetical protein